MRKKAGERTAFWQRNHLNVPDQDVRCEDYRDRVLWRLDQNNKRLANAVIFSQSNGGSFSCNHNKVYGGHREDTVWAGGGGLGTTRHETPSRGPAARVQNDRPMNRDARTARSKRTLCNLSGRSGPHRTERNQILLSRARSISKGCTSSGVPPLFTISLLTSRVRA